MRARPSLLPLGKEQDEAQENQDANCPFAPGVAARIRSLSCHSYTRLLVVLVGHSKSLLYSQVSLGL